MAEFIVLIFLPQAATTFAHMLGQQDRVYLEKTPQSYLYISVCYLFPGAAHSSV